MTPQTFAALWPLLRGTLRAHLQGWGEPLLHPRFFDFAELAVRAGCQVSTTSSGMIMNGDTAQKIVASGMDLIAFSLAGTDAQSNSVRAGAPFERVCKSVRILRKTIDEYRKSGLSGPEIHLAYLLLADRFEAAAGLPRLMEELGAEMAVVSNLDYLAAPEHSELAFAPDDERKIGRARTVLENAAAEAESCGRIIRFALPDKNVEGMPGGCRENVARSLYVDADGLVSPCVYLNAPGNDPAEKRRVFGDAGRENPWQIWNGAEYRAFRENLRAMRPDPVCLNCPKRREKTAD